MIHHTVSGWYATKYLVDLLDQGAGSDDERMEILTGYFKGLIDGKRQDDDPGRRLEDDEARLEAQGYEDWLRTDPGRRLDDHEARLRRLEDWVEGTVYPNRQAQAGDRPTDTA
mgnify:CR=1 FL=1